MGVFLGFGWVKAEDDFRDGSSGHLFGRRIWKSCHDERCSGGDENSTRALCSDGGGWVSVSIMMMSEQRCIAMKSEQCKPTTVSCWGRRSHAGGRARILLYSEAHASREFRVMTDRPFDILLITTAFLRPSNFVSLFSRSSSPLVCCHCNTVYLIKSIVVWGNIVIHSLQQDSCVRTFNDLPPTYFIARYKVAESV